MTKPVRPIRSRTAGVRLARLVLCPHWWGWPMPQCRSTACSVSRPGFGGTTQRAEKAPTGHRPFHLGAFAATPSTCWAGLSPSQDNVMRVRIGEAEHGLFEPPIWRPMRTRAVASTT